MGWGRDGMAPLPRRGAAASGRMGAKGLHKVFHPAAACTGCRAERFTGAQGDSPERVDGAAREKIWISRSVQRAREAGKGAVSEREIRQKACRGE
jgi:hypothetical protein